MPENILSVRHLYAGYDKKDTVKDISFYIEPNQIVGLVGLNGAGKTTLIKTIVGLREINSGSIEKRNPHLAFLPERFEAPSFLTGFEFIQFHLKSYKKNISHKEIEKHAARVSFDSNALDKKIKTYSKGMRQKIGILATMLAKCSLTILDEPMSGLDPKARYDVKNLIKKAPENGHSILMTSHVLNDVLELCEKVIVIDRGESLFSGSIPDLLEKGKDKDIEKAFLNLIELK
jgi:ABC-2 type transport system ATP-binding protein